MSKCEERKQSWAISWSWLNVSSGSAPNPEPSLPFFPQPHFQSARQRGPLIHIASLELGPAVFTSDFLKTCPFFWSSLSFLPLLFKTILLENCLDRASLLLVRAASSSHWPTYNASGWARWLWGEDISFKTLHISTADGNQQRSPQACHIW